MSNWLKKLNILKRYKARCIGVDFLNRRIVVIEPEKCIHVNKSIEEIISEIPDKRKYKKVKEGFLSDDYWQNLDTLNYLIDYSIKEAKLGSSHYHLFIVLPYENYMFFHKKIHEVLSKTIKTYFCKILATLNNIQCIFNHYSYHGRIKLQDESGRKKSWFLFLLNEGFYLGYAFGDFVVEAICIKDSYDKITPGVIVNKIKELLKTTSQDLLEELKNNEVFTDKEINNMIKDWEKPFEKTIYFYVPEKFKKIFGDSIYKYNIEYLDYDELSVIKGLEKFILSITQKNEIT
ncbi:MAG: hypothetical protein GX387_03685 [Clostridium sp.]|jgi:hypothetical protein|nr:hypothetical protein [Clostridium sp.]